MALNLYSRDKVIEYIPEWNSNRESDNPFVVKLKFLNYNEITIIQREIRNKAKGIEDPDQRGEVILEVQAKMLKENIVGIENVSVDGVPIQSVSQFIELNIEDLIEELADAMTQITKMSEGERKNSEGASDGNSGSLTKTTEAPSSVTHAVPPIEELEIVETLKD